MKYKNKWIRTGEAGKRLGYTSKHIRTLCKQHKLVHKVDDSGNIRVSAEDIDRVLNDELRRGWDGQPCLAPAITQQTTRSA